MGAWLFAAILSTLHLEGDAVKAGGDYVRVPFAVPAGTVEIHIDHANRSAEDILDWGVWGPSGFRGWSGGLAETLVVGVAESSRGYLPGAIASGDGWEFVIGKAKIDSEPAHWTADIAFHDAATLTPLPRAPFQERPLQSGARFYKGDFHVHSRSSGDAAATLDEIVALARARGLDFVVITDHNTVAQQPLHAALQAQAGELLMLRGIEVTTYGGHGNAVSAGAYVDHRIGLDGRTAAQMIRDVNAQGGLFIVNHPKLDLGLACIGCAWSHADTPWPEVAAIEIHTGPYRLGLALFTLPSIAMWDERLDAGARLAAVGGSDDHRAGKDLPSTASPIGSPTTLVWADELSEAAITSGVRDGRTMVQLRGPDDPRLEIVAEDGSRRARLGDTVRAGRVTVEAHVASGEGFEFSLFLNGAEVARSPVDKADWTRRIEVRVPPGGGRLRAHLTDQGDPVVVTSHLWLEHAPSSGCAIGAPGAPADVALLALLWLLARATRRGQSFRFIT